VEKEKENKEMLEKSETPQIKELRMPRVKF
jgi:hypothetical protein